MNVVGIGAKVGLAAFWLIAAGAASASVEQRVMRVGDVRVEYKLVLPDAFDPAKEYPAIVVFGGGPQTMETVDRTLERNFRAEAERRGYIVVAPAAPAGRLFFERGAQIFPAFLDTILSQYKIAGRKFHIAGPSNGGIAAMHVAAAHPDYFLSATAFPGYLWQPTETKLAGLANANVCVFLYIGEDDEYRWHDEMRREAEFLEKRGTFARFDVEAGQPHRLDTLAGDKAVRLFEGFALAERGCSRR